MRALIVLVLLAACGDNITPTQPSSPIARYVLAPCTDFEEMQDRSFRQLVPFIEPLDVGTMVVVAASPFFSLWGESDPSPDGGTLVWAPQRWVWIDGVEYVGAVGRPDDGEMCEWLDAATVIEP